MTDTREMPIMVADTLRGGFYVLPYGRMFARTFILDPVIVPLTIDPTAWPDSFVMGSTDLNTISLGASEEEARKEVQRMIDEERLRLNTALYELEEKEAKITIKEVAQ